MKITPRTSASTQLVRHFADRLQRLENDRDNWSVDLVLDVVRSGAQRLPDDRLKVCDCCSMFLFLPLPAIHNAPPPPVCFAETTALAL